MLWARRLRRAFAFLTTFLMMPGLQAGADHDCCSRGRKAGAVLFDGCSS
jgi:hypothetical protein